LIVSVLFEAANPSPETLDATSSTMFQWSVAQLLKRLDADNTVPETVIAQLEWTYLGLLEYSERLPIVLHRAMSKDAAFFVQVLSATCVAHSASAEDRTQISDEAKAIASHAFRLLQSWNTVPGATETEIDASALISWVREAHQLASRRTARQSETNTLATRYLFLKPLSMEFGPICQFGASLRR
jgi:hypothetical protein